MVYFIQDGDDGPIKIGFSKTPQVRIAAIQVNHAREIKILAITDGEREDERKIHQSLANHHIRGEWFLPSDDVLSAAMAAKQVPPRIVAAAPIPPPSDVPRHPLRKWCFYNNVTSARFARKAGIDSGYLSRVICGTIQPSRHVADALSEATGGEVSPGDIMAWMPEDPVKAAG